VVDSLIVPTGIEVTIGSTIPEYNDFGAVMLATGRNRANRDSRFMMKRDNYLTARTNGFDVRYAGTNVPVPEDEAINLINGLMDNGFDLEFNFSGSIRGVKEIRCTGVVVTISRLDK
jgi:hypothetical protein